MNKPANAFRDAAKAGLENAALQENLSRMRVAMPFLLDRARAKLPEFDNLREEARALKDHTLAHLDFYLERFAARVEDSGGHVHWCATAAEARAAVIAICQDAGAKTVTKGKSMVTEEIGLNHALEAAGITPVETDLGEYIIQKRGEMPSHVLAPAIHVTQDDVAATFRAVHDTLDPARPLETVPELMAEARMVLRDRFLAADVGITGANFLVAETGSTVIVTNEGNGDLTQILPRVHIVVTAIEKVVPTLDDVATLLRVLVRSTGGQDISSYVTLSTGPRRQDDQDGPEAFHVVLLDNGRSELLGTEFREALRCVRCGACMNHCPVYNNIGGHAYGSVYPGPIGAILTPVLNGLATSYDLAAASTFCGRCATVCPVKIPIPKLLRAWRNETFAARLQSPLSRLALKLWGFCAARPTLYGPVAGLGAWVLRRMARHGAIGALPFGRGWTATRDMPAPEGATFRAQWQKTRKKGQTR